MDFESYYMLQLVPVFNDEDGFRANWEEHVRSIIVSMAHVQTGQALLAGIAWWNRWVAIFPYDFHYHGDFGVYANKMEAPGPDGRSYGALVHFSPEMVSVLRFLNGWDNAYGAAPNEALFHELVHAFRLVSGKMKAVDERPQTTGGLVEYSNTEEFYAVLLTNIFISDPSNHDKTGLRGGVQDFKPLGAGLATSMSFFESSRDAFDLVQTFCTDHPGLSPVVAKVPAKFNPIAAYFKDPAEAKKRSQSAEATVRDGGGWAKVIGGLLLRDAMDDLP